MFRPFHVVELAKENDLSKVIKQHKREAEPFTVLFHSLWDENSRKVLEHLRSVESEEGEVLYLVDSFNMPHSFVIYNTVIVPAIVKVNKDAVETIDYLPHVYKYFELN